MNRRRIFPTRTVTVIALLCALLRPASATAVPAVTPVHYGYGGLFSITQTQWIRDEPGDPGWAFGVDGSDPYGVCSIFAAAGSSASGTSWTNGPGANDWGISSCTNAPTDLTWTYAGTDWNGFGYQAPTFNTLTLYPTSGTLNLTVFVDGGDDGGGGNTANYQTRLSGSWPVDNEPVGVSFSTPNDANPTVWVDHAVVVDAGAVTGPSGESRMVCSVDKSAGQPYPAGGLTVNGDGIRTVACTAWNNAVDPTGNDASGGGTLNVKIDEQPPSLSIEPDNPTNPAQVVVDTSDGESGVAGGSIELAPKGTDAWTKLPTTFTGSQLLATIDDAGLSGLYTVQATSCDNAGNCATTSEGLALPLRIQATADVSLERIVDPLRPEKVRERVRVGWHWATVHRHRRTLVVKRGGHWETITVIKRVERCTLRRARSSRHRWKLTSVCRAPRIALTSSERVGFGRQARVHGLLLTAQGVPIAGAAVRILTAPTNGLQQFTEATSATTDAAGGWTATLPAGPSRLISAVYPGSQTILPASGQARLTVPARIEITVHPRAVRWGGAIVIRGRVLGGYVPHSSKLLRLDIGVDGVHAIQGIPSIAPNGNFRTTYTFRHFNGRVRFWFTVSTLPESSFPWAPGRSRRVYVTVY